MSIPGFWYEHMIFSNNWALLCVLFELEIAKWKILMDLYYGEKKMTDILQRLNEKRVKFWTHDSIRSIDVYITPGYRNEWFDLIHAGGSSSDFSPLNICNFTSIMGFRGSNVRVRTWKKMSTKKKNESLVNRMVGTRGVDLDDKEKYSIRSNDQTLLSQPHPTCSEVRRRKLFYIRKPWFILLLRLTHVTMYLQQRTKGQNCEFGIACPNSNTQL